jgi:hypothetical protein
MKNQFKQDKGTAGLTLLLSLIVMLFIIGLIVMIFSLMGSELKDATYNDLTSVSVVNESISVPTTAGVTLAGGSARNGLCGTVVLINGTGGDLISSGNYTQTNCVLVNTTSEFDDYTTPLATYDYTWSADNTATDVMNDTVSGVSGVSDWFDIFIVIGAMVVLILLTVIIITAIRSSGMVAGSTSGARSVGTA